MEGTEGNENLAEMLKTQSEEATTEQSEELDLHVSEDPTEETGTKVEEEETFDISTVSLVEWVKENHESLYPIKHVKLSVEGVDPVKNLALAVPIPGQEEKEPSDWERKLHVFEDADEILVLNLPSSTMDIFNNGFRIVHNYNDTIIIKCYGVKTGLFVVFCNNINDQLIPYAITKLQKRDKGIVNVPSQDPAEVLTKLAENADTEELQILYKQISKSVGDIVTKQDVVDWFLKRQAEITDINHHLQIDNVLMHILG